MTRAGINRAMHESHRSLLVLAHRKISAAPIRKHRLLAIAALAVIVHLSSTTRLLRRFAFVDSFRVKLAEEHRPAGVFLRRHSGRWRNERLITLHAETSLPPEDNLETVQKPTPSTRMLPLFKKVLIATISVVISFALLISITAGFESLVHNSSGLLKGKVGILTAVFAGLLSGALHTLAGPDHLAALAPLVVGRQGSPAVAFVLGCLWGSGHATGQVILGVVVLAVQAGFLQQGLIAAVGRISGVLAGCILILIGVKGIMEARSFEDSDAQDMESESANRYNWTTYMTGVVHGLQPDTFLFLAPVLAFPLRCASAFVVCFALGTLLSMGACTSLLAAVCCRSPRLIRQISFSASSVACIMGVSIIAASLGMTVSFLG